MTRDPDSALTAAISSGKPEPTNERQAEELSSLRDGHGRTDAHHCICVTRPYPGCPVHGAIAAFERGNK